MSKVMMLILSVFLVSLKSQAFPTTIRHGYSSCFTCHYSPSGGGILKPYGRIIAGELYSAHNNSENALPWLKKPDDKESYAVSLMARGVQSHYENEYVKQGKFRRMQFDIEAGYLWKKFFAFITSGMRAGSASGDQKDTDLFVRRFFAGAEYKDFIFTVGRFTPEFGIRHPNHRISTRKGLYFDQGQETNTFQINYFREKIDVAIAALEGARESNFANRYGFSGSLVYKTSHMRAGVSHMNLSNTQTSDSATSLFTHIGYGRGYTLMEIAARGVEVKSTTGATKSSSELAYLESGWEVMRAVIPYIGYEHTGTISSSNYQRGYLLGLSYYPLTHMESRLQLATLKSESGGKTSGATAAFAMFNIYF